MTNDQLFDELSALLQVDDPGEIIAAVREFSGLRPLVWTDSANGLHVAPLTVRQVVQIIGALEGLTVK